MPLTPPSVLSPGPLLPVNVSSVMPMISAPSASATSLLPPGFQCYDTPSPPCSQSSPPIPSSNCDTPSIPAHASPNPRITLDEALQVVGEHIEAAGNSVIEPLHPSIAYLYDQIHKEERCTILQLLIFLHSQLDVSDTEAEEDPPDHAVPMSDPTPPDVEEDPDPPPAYSVDSSPTPIPNSLHAPDPAPTCPISPIFVFSQDGELRAVYPTSSNAGPFAPDPPFAPNVIPLQTFPSEATSEGDQSFCSDSFL